MRGAATMLAFLLLLGLMLGTAPRARDAACIPPGWWVQICG